MANLVLYETARDALQECKYTDEVKDWVDRAAATQAYARMAKDKTLEVDAAEIRIRAERRLGEMLSEQKESGGLSRGGRPAKTGSATEPVTLAEVGIDKKLSARAQKIAAVPAPEFEAEISDWRERVSAEGERVTARLESSGGAALAGKDPAPEPDENADRMTDLLADYEAASRVIQADDKLAEAMALVKEKDRRLDALNRLYQEKCAELAAMVREAKRWKTKFEKLEAATREPGSRG